MKYILASQSPRRREILSMLGLHFEVVTSHADENSDLKDPYLLVEELSRRKGRAVRERLLSEGAELSDTLIISSDTVVYCSGEILGKPEDAADACRMLRMYSGGTHEVVSGICLLYGETCRTAHEVTRVTFDRMTEDEICTYVEKEQPYDKAGAYAIQGSASAFIKGIEGDFYNVVGLPVHRLALLYRELFGRSVIAPEPEQTQR